MSRTYVQTRVRLPASSAAPFFLHDVSTSQSKTKEFDDTATAHLLYLVAPLMVGYAAYSLLNQQHRGWYSWVLNSLVGFVYMFGFVMMTPQLFINYKVRCRHPRAHANTGEGGCASVCSCLTSFDRRSQHSGTAVSGVGLGCASARTLAVMDCIFGVRFVIRAPPLRGRRWSGAGCFPRWWKGSMQIYLSSSNYEDPCCIFGKTFFQ